MSANVEYVRYSEFCDNEGETWHRFIPLTVNGEKNKALENFSIAVAKLSEEFKDEYDGSPYGFYLEDDGTMKKYSQAHVDILLEENADSECGYHEEYGVSNVKDLDLNVPEGTDNFEHFDSQIYKLQWEK